MCTKVECHIPAEERGDTCKRGGGGGRPGGGVKSAPGLGRDEGRSTPDGPDGPRPAGTLVEGVGGRIDEEGADEDGVLTEVLFLILQKKKRGKKQHAKIREE